MSGVARAQVNRVMDVDRGVGSNHKLFLAGEWRETGAWEEVRSPYDGSVVARVSTADAELTEEAIQAAHIAFCEGILPQHRRAEILDRAAVLVAERSEDFSRTIAAEAGKPVKSARVEVSRCVETLRFSAAEARSLTGHTVPMDASASGVGKLGIVLRVPYGVVGAISPFNFPVNLVAHKLGPAIAAGNAVVLKPAEATPVSALKLARVFEDAGLPDGWLSVLPGDGKEVGGTLVGHDLVRAISFTGSGAVGWGIRSAAPSKKVNLELGSNAPLIVDENSDWERAADKAAEFAFANAGQTCVSVQRILVHERIASPFSERLVKAAEALKVGDPRSDSTDVGPLISEEHRDRVIAWIDEAVASGADLLTGGSVVDAGRCVAPTLLGHPSKDAKVWCDEIFGPVATVDTFDTIDEALTLANSTRFGLNVGVFTKDLETALAAARRLEFGGVLINDVPTVRSEQQPYGGVKESGNTREGPASAVRELTEERFVSFQP